MKTSSDRRLALGIFFLVLGVYLFTYVGAFKSNDERAYFSGMDSFVKRGVFTANQIYWDYTNVGMLTKQGDMVPNYEPAQMVIPIPLYLWGRALGAAVQGTFFFNPLIVAASAAMLYLCFVELGYRRATGLLGTLVYAFATLAWPYSRTFFREPLTTLGYLVAFYALLRYAPPAPRRARWAALVGFGVGLAVVTKLISVGVVPGLVLLAFGYEWRRPAEPGRGVWISRLRMAVAAAIPLSFMLLLYQAYNSATLSDVEMFARNIVDYTTNPQLSQSVPMRMLNAGMGITISPYKGLFWYCPVLLLGLIGAYWFTRRHLWEGLACLLIVGAHILGYSRYNFWSGGVAWGMRYLLPIIPFLVLLAAPVWDMLTRKGPSPETTPDRSPWPRRLAVTGSWLLVAVSLGIQVLGVSIDLVTWEVKWLLDNIPIYGGVGETIDTLFMRPEISPVLGHLRLLLSGQPLDFAWVQQRPQGAIAVVPAGLILSLVLAASGIAACAVIWRRPGVARWVAAVMIIVMLVGMSGLVLIYRQGDARYDKYDVDRFLKPMMADLANDARCERTRLLADGLRLECQDVFIMPDPALTDYFLNYLDAPLPWYSLEAKPVDEDLAGRLTARYGRILLGRDRNAQTDDQEDQRAWEGWLTDNAYKLDERRYEDWARLLRFSAGGTRAEKSQPGQQLGEFTLTEAELSVEGARASAQPLSDGKVIAKSGDTLQVALSWRAGRQPEANYTAFLQLLDAASQVKAQSDRWPGDGLHPTAALQEGGSLTDRVALPLAVPTGTYRLIAGLYRGDAPGAPRLAGPDGDHVVLATVEVEP